MAEIKKNKITAQDILKFEKCGGYHGTNGKQSLNAEETCFGMYTYLIDNMLSLRSLKPSERKSDYIQAQIDMLCALLKNYVLSNCIDQAKHEINFSVADFEKANKYLVLQNGSPLSNYSQLMPYVVQYVLMQNGIKLRNENCVVDVSRQSADILHQPYVGGNAYIYASQTMQSINNKNVLEK